MTHQGRQDISKHFSQLVTRRGYNKEESTQRELSYTLGTGCQGNLFEILHTFLFVIISDILAGVEGNV